MKHIIDYIKKNSWIWLLVVPAFIIYLLIIFPSGSYYCFKDKCGLFFWGVHGHDAIWHLAVSNVSFTKIPFIQPTFSGATLTGYNYLLDLLIYLIAKIGIPSVITYFKILPVVWFILYTVLLIALARKIKDTPLFVGIFLFFTYFSESFSYILNLLHHKSIWGAADLLATIKVHMMSNPPFAFSILILLGVLLFIKKGDGDLKTIVVIGFLNFLNLGLKFYGGAITTFLIFIYILFNFFNKDWKKFFLYSLINGIFLITAILVFYDPFSSLKTGSIFTISPFALIHTITEEPDLFYMQKLTNARYFLMSKGIGPRLIMIELFNLVVFFFFYLGVKFFGLLYVGYKLLKNKLTQFDWYIILTMLFATLLTITLVQKAQWWNVIQFFYYVIFLSSIFMADLAFNLFKKRNIWLKTLVLVMMILAIPNTLDVVKSYATFPAASFIPEKELQALAFLKKQPEGMAFTPVYNRALKTDIAPNEMYRYEDTAYIAAFTDKPVYLADTTQLGLTGVNYEERLKKIQTNDCFLIKEINYVYYIRQLPQEWKIISCAPQDLKQLFSNEAVIIYGLKK